MMSNDVRRLRPGLFLAAVATLAIGGAAQMPEPASAQKRAPAQATATFAGGCFWCTEADFEKLPGVLSAVSGYTGGHLANPTYEQVTAGGTGHFEAVRITYDPARIGYAQLVRHFFRTVDPLDPGGQFCDRGESYRTAVFYADAEQRRLADAERAGVARTLGKKVVTPLLAARAFYPAEAYHQDYYKRNPIRYRFYRSRCGRDARLKTVWKGR